MHIDVITLFPEMIASNIKVGVVGRARERGLLHVNIWNPRAATRNIHHTVDGRPYGGGPGMVMQIEPLRQTLQMVKAQSNASARTIYLSPQGGRLTQTKVADLAHSSQLILLCGRYEGIDERFLQHEIDEELSIGDYVLSGGELAAAVVIDAIGRLQTGVLNDKESAEQDSFSQGLLDCPHYTRPEKHEFGDVPDVLLSGNHAAIRRWRLKQSLGRTWLRRPDLLARCNLNKESQQLLEEFKKEHFQ